MKCDFTKLGSSARLQHRNPRVKASRQYCVVVKASGDRKKVDWDKEWSSYQQRSTGSSRNSKRSNSRIPVDPAAKMTRDAIKREEAFMLNAWSSNMFQGAGVAVAIIVLLAVVVTAGPPPADSRCTLPWC